jgi:hypothetical protein
MKTYYIECRTGCTCCCEENHIRGFYRSEEDAKRRMNYYLSPDSKFWPLASQYARRGIYDVRETDVEDLKDGRYIFEGEKVLQSLDFMHVKEDGSIEDDGKEHLW